MRFLFVTFTLGLLFLGKFSLAETVRSKNQNKNEKKAKATSIESTSRIAELLISTVPQKNLREGLKEYLSIIDAKSYKEGEVGFENSGITNYFNTLFYKNKCYRQSVLNFYKDISEKLRSNNPCLDGNEDEEDDRGLYGCYSARPTIDEKTEMGKKKYLKSGWLFELAKKHAKGNPELALELISICGHDDIKQGAFWLLSKDQTKNIDTIKEFVDGFNCPNSKADFFLPGSLSKEANLKPELISKIKELQGNPKFTPPAKYYHIYAGAFMACKLTKKQIPLEQAVSIEKMAAKIYRGLRMCEAVKNLENYKDVFLNSVKIKNFNDSKEIESLLFSKWQDKMSGRLKCEGSGLLLNTDCRWMDKIGILKLNSAEEKIAKQKIQTAFSRNDAAFLYKQWYLGGNQIAGHQTPCTDIRLSGPKDLLKPENDLLKFISKPQGWSDERYKAATKVLATWDLDFEWTLAQHEVGARFGAEACGNSMNQPNPINSKDCIDSDFGSNQRIEMPKDFFNLDPLGS